MMSLTFDLFTQVSGSGPLGPLVLCCPFLYEMSWMRSGTELSQFPRIFLPAFTLHTATIGYDKSSIHFQVPFHLAKLYSKNELHV